MRRVSVGLASTLLGLWLVAGAAAQDPRQNEPGKFDFYVLALSWSPSFCEQAGERAPRQQCGERPYSFVVHGLWPQYERGFPEFCQNPAPRLNRNIVSSMLDLMPAPRLIFHEWDKHGVCSGPAGARLFRDGPQGARPGEDSGRISRAGEYALGLARRGGGRLREGEPGSQSRGDRGDLRRNAAFRSAHLHVARPAIPRVSGDRQARVPPRSAEDAAGARGRIDAALRSFLRKRECRAPARKNCVPAFARTSGRYTRGDELSPRVPRRQYR